MPIPERIAGALIISLDFELHWGVRDRVPLDRVESARLLAARAVVPRLLNLFERHRIQATWAIVGFLFARSGEELKSFSPVSRPNYRDSRLNPYAERIGGDEASDPFHFAPSLIDRIAQTSGQEIATHSFSHYYALEAGQNECDFAEDLDSALKIAHRAGYGLESYVFPRNQANPAYLPILAARGIRCFRGNEIASVKAPEPFADQRRAHKRVIRLADSYVNLHGPQTSPWPDAAAFDSLISSVPAGRYLRPFSPALAVLEPLRLRRITTALQSAATRNEVFHLWWHPEDFAHHPDRSLAFLDRVLTAFDIVRQSHGMITASMAGVCATPNSTSFEGAAVGA